MKFENFVYVLIVVLCLLIIIVSSFILTTTKKDQGFIELFFVPNSYSDILNEDRNVTFSYKIINNEGKPLTYEIEILSGNIKIDSKNVFLEDKQEYLENYSFILPENVTLPVEVSVVLRNLNQSIHFWIWEIR
jgi:hypothetical protein